MKTIWQAFGTLDMEDRIKFALLLVLKVVIFPLQLVFFVVRSAWEDAREIGWWFLPKAVCEHGIDRRRVACEPCETADADRAFSEIVHPRQN